MTISNTARSAGPFTGTGALATYPFTFKVFTAADVLVVATDSSGVQSTWVLSADYTVTLSSDQNTAPGGVVSALSALPVGHTLLITSSIAVTQNASLTNTGGFFPKVIEDALDRLTILLQQQGYISTTQTLRVPEVGGVATLPAAAERASRLLGFDASGAPTALLPGAGDATALALDLLSSAAGKGDSLLGVLHGAAGAVATTQHQVNQRTLSLFDFCSATQIADWTAGTLAQDFTAPLQALFDACSSGAGYLGWRGELPPGRGKITAKLRSKSKYIHIRGAGMWQSQIVYSGVAAGCIVADAMLYWSPTFEDFAIAGDAASGHAIDGSAITSDIYNGGIRHLYIEAGKAALYFNTVFSFDFTGVVALSYTDHIFRVRMGNTTVMRQCYAISAPAGKCGYRLGGNIYLDQCNGVDSLGIWGIFGNDPTATDGWQSDFPGVDYPDVYLHNCNLEAFTVAGLIIHNSVKNFFMEGGKIDRSAFSTAYHSMVWARLQGQTAAPLRFSVGTVNAGAGQAVGGTFAAGILTPGALINAQFRAAGGVWFSDESGQLAAGLTSYGFVGKFYADNYSSLIPFASVTAGADVYGDTSLMHNALSPRRLSLQTVRYKLPGVALTPVGAAQAIDVTGYSRVTVSPAAAASISTATFNATQSAGLDYDRNGDLLIEAGNGNLTINHTARGGAVNTFVMAGGANVGMAAGRVLRFIRSVTNGQWEQV